MRRLRSGAVVVSMLLIAACGGDHAAVVHLYDHAPVPPVPDRTTPIDGGWATSGKGLAGLADGQYWSEKVMDRNGALQFELSQALFGSACEAVAAAEQCVDGYVPVRDPSGTVVVPAASLTTVTVAGGDRQNFAITGAELLVLVNNGEPDPLAPDSYVYMHFPFLLTVTGGTVTEARQVWVAAS
jgi:hypothetical protein